MNEPTQPTPTAPTKPARRSRKRAAAGPRKLDPGIAAIREEMRLKVAEYRRTCNSERILKTIVEKRLSQMTHSDQQKLFDTLSAMVTPALPLPA